MPDLPRILRDLGASVSRQKFQRPEVYKSGKRVKVWRGEFRVYVKQADGSEKAKHTSVTIGRCSVLNKAEAQQRLDKIVAQRTGKILADGRITLQQFFEQVYLVIKGQKWALNTRRANESTLKYHVYPALGGIALEDLQKFQIEKHLLSLADSGHSQSTVNRACVLIKSALEEAVDNEIIPRNIARKITPPKCRAKRDSRSLTIDEVKHLFATTHGRTRLLFRLLILCGLRIGEALALRWRDVGDDGWLRISRSCTDGAPVPTKNSKERLVPCPSSLMAELKSWRSMVAYDRPDDAVLASRLGNIMWRQAAAKTILASAIRKSGIKDLNFHMCRRTFSTLIEGDVRDVQEMLGHSSAGITLRHYKKALPDRQKIAVEQLDRRLM
jgi:integrase